MSTEEREQTTIQDECRVHNERSTVASIVPESTDQSLGQLNGSVQYNTPYGLNQTSTAQSTLYLNGCDQLLPGNENENRCRDSSNSNERETSLPTYGELYPDEEKGLVEEGLGEEGLGEEGLGEETDRDSSATYRYGQPPPHTGNNQSEDDRCTDLDRTSSTGYSRGQTLPSTGMSGDGVCNGEMFSVQPEVTDSNNAFEHVVVKETNDADVNTKRNKSVARRKSKVKQNKRRKVLDLEIEELLAIPQEYPPPRPSKTSKADITSPDIYKDPDRKAEQVTPESVDTIEELLLKLTGELTKEVQIVRALIMWIWHHTGDDIDLPYRPDRSSPMGYLKRLMSGNISYSELFTLLCRTADIPCVLVDGFAKGNGYDVGKESLTNLTNTWTAVYVAGGWRLVFPLWILTNEADEEENSTVEMDDGDNLNEFFFLTDPEEFIFRCFPVKTDWQLLHNSFSKERFKRLPYVSSSFFGSYIQLPTLQDGTIQASNGYCKLNLTLREGREEDAKLSTDMTFDRKKSDEDISADVQLERYVAIIHSNKSRRVNVRVPCNGVYRLKLSDSKRGWLCSFLIVCGKSAAMRNAFPEHPLSHFGPSISTLDAGLVPNSHINGVINIHVSQDTIVSFDMTKELSIKSKLLDCKNDVSQYVTHNIEDNELKVTVKVPVVGEYSLVIFCRGNHSTNPYIVACNYLLTTENVHTRSRTLENPAEKKARERLVFVTEKSHNPEVLQQALDAFQMLKLNSKGEVGPATEKLNFLKIKQELTESIKRKNRQMLGNSIVQAQACESHPAELAPCITEAETCLSGLSAPSVRHNVLRMERRTVSEISRYKKPRPLVHDIMKATMILLGESYSNVEHWPNIQKYMKRSGKNGFLNRIKQFDISGANVEAAEQAYRLVDRYDRVSAICGGSAGVGTFYVWVTDVTERVLGMENN